MEKVEILIQVLGVGYACSIGVLIYQLRSNTTDVIMLVTVYTLAFTFPCFWMVVRICRQAGRKQEVPPVKVLRKRPKVAVPQEKIAIRTQAEILAEQRARVKKLHQSGKVLQVN
uniref:Uncharacterized protein AlNc14C513G12012 n=1 Tax=Albugo laibachii Nc14 TaxID=890382 RepID=F0X0R8_9STRA|nr:conserved hypothetical protein [Albugo laibachii Nc14]|eukprot:CCA27362.1 conserved hypothetical protein [Albugo laibachii Nc14]